MADQDPKTGAVDPRPEELETGAKTGQAAPSAPKTDAAGKDTAAVSGSANSAATPTPAPSKTDTQSSGGEASAKTDPVKSLVDEHADDNDGRTAIIVAGTSVRSVANTSGMVAKAETQSTDMQTGAQVAHDNAFMSLVKRLETLAEKFGKEIAAKIAIELGKFHDIEDVVKNALAKAGVTD